jgi:hypothetical protein
MVVKTNLDGDIRRFAHQDSRTLDQLKRLIQTSYGLEEEAFALRYTDGDGDAVTLLSLEDFEEAMTVAAELGKPDARPVLRILVSKKQNNEDEEKKEERKREWLKEWSKQLERLRESRHLVALLGDKQVELLSLGGAEFFLRCISPTAPGNGRIRIVPDEAGSFRVECHAGFGNWAKFIPQQLDTGVAFRNLGSGKFLALSHGEFCPAEEPFPFAVNLDEVGSVPLDVALRVVKELMGFAKAMKEKEKAADKIDKSTCVGKRIVHECVVQLGALAYKLLHLQNGMVCITPIQPHPQFGSGNIRVREAGALDFRGRRGKWAQFKLVSVGAKAALFHRATNTFLGLAPSGELISSQIIHEFDGLAPMPFALMHIKSRNLTSITEVARFMTEAEAQDALRQKEAGGQWCGFVVKEDNGQCTLSLGSTSRKPIEGRTWTDVTLACCVANNIHTDGPSALPSASMPFALMDQKLCNREGCMFVEHPKQHHGFCCNGCKVNGKHGPACLQLVVGQLLPEKQALKALQQKEAKEAAKVEKEAAREVEKEAKRAAKAEKEAEKEAKRAAKAAEKEAKRAAKAEAKARKAAERGFKTELQLGPFTATLSKLSAKTCSIHVPSLGKGNVRFKPTDDGGVCTSFNGGQGKWAIFRIESAPFDQVYFINDATGMYLGLDSAEHLTPCDGYKFVLKDSDGMPVSLQTDSDWEQAIFFF